MRKEGPPRPSFISIFPPSQKCTAIVDICFLLQDIGQKQTRSTVTSVINYSLIQSLSFFYKCPPTFHPFPSQVCARHVAHWKSVSLLLSPFAKHGEFRLFRDAILTRVLFSFFFFTFNLHFINSVAAIILTRTQ